MPPRKKEPIKLANPLYSRAAESAILGLAIREKGDVANGIVAELAEDDFFDGQNRTIFCALRTILDDSSDINPVSVAVRSGCTGVYLADLVNSAGECSPGDSGSLVQEIQRAAALRRVSKVIGAANDSIQNGERSADEILIELEAGLYSGRASAAKDAREAWGVAKDVLTNFANRYKSGGGTEISTGLKEVDRAIIGVRGGKVWVVGGRPGMGKTALSGTVNDAVLQQGYGTLIFSMEMQAEELIERHIAAMTHVNSRKIASGKNVTQEELSRLMGVSQRVPRDLWYIDDTTYSLSGIRRRSKIVANRLARRGTKLGLIIVDYLQLATAGLESREQDIAAVSRGLKALSKEHDCMVMALSQLNRSCETRDNKRPTMSDLRESGAIEQDADIITFVYRDSVYNKSADREDAELIVAKQRAGPIGTIHLKYSGPLVRFFDAPQMDSEVIGNEAT